MQFQNVQEGMTDLEIAIGVSLFFSFFFKFHFTQQL